MCLQIVHLTNTYKDDLALNYQQWLICHKTKLNLYLPIYIYNMTYNQALVV